MIGIVLIFTVNTWNEGWFSNPSSPKSKNPDVVLENQTQTQSKQILFGDLHVHTTYSMDAYAISLPMLNGEGAHPPKDACDYARYCSALDFWSINDHAEGLTPKQWQEEKDLIRQCNASAGDPKNPDMVSFLGWEWTQMGTTVESHYGHRNVIFKDTDEDKVPARTVAASGPYTELFSGPPFLMRNI